MRRPKEYTCATCTHRHCDESGEMEGSRGPAPFPKWEINGEVFRVCPLPQVTEFSREMLKLHMHYKNGYLPENGGLMRQPAGFLRAMEIIESVPVSVSGDR